MPTPNPANRLPKRQHRTPGDFGRGHLKVDNMLRDEDRDAYYALLRRPETTGRSAWEWLTARGYRVTVGAVKRHKRKFDLNLKAIRRSAEMSLVCAELIRQVGAHKMSDAAVLRFETLLTQALFKYERGEALAKPEWEMLGRALTTAVMNRSRVESVRLADEAARREAGGDARGKRKWVDGNALADKVRRRLGMPLLDEVKPQRPALPAPEPRTAESNTPSPQPSPGGRGSEGPGIPTPAGTPAPIPPLPPGEGVRDLGARTPPEQPAPIPPLPPGEGRGEGV